MNSKFFRMAAYSLTGLVGATLATATLALLHKPSRVFLAQTAGSLAGVEKKIDTGYTDYYLTRAELVNPRNVDPAEMTLLANDTHFKNHPCYLVTAVQEQPKPKGALKQRSFIVNPSDFQQLGLSVPNAGDVIGDKTEVITYTKCSFGTLGQYLAPFVEIFPRVQTVKTTDASLEDVARVNEELSKQKPTRSFDWHYQGPTTKLTR